jgi:aryl-alcohol dehydrogenase-like predicted oxidoreductase
MARSVFLQGVLLLEPADLPRPVSAAAPAIAAWVAVCERYGLRREEAAIQLVRTLAPEADVVIGCEHMQQLVSNLRAWRAPRLAASVVDEIEHIPTVDEHVLDPRTWLVGKRA